MLNKHNVIKMAHSTRKLGVTFTWLGWILGILLLVAGFDHILQQQNNPNRSVQSIRSGNYEEIVLQRNRQGHYLFNGKINNKTVTFLVDTGATTTTIPAHLAQKLKLEKGRRFSVQTANGSSYAFATLIDNLQLGDIQFNRVTASLNPGLQGNEILLGMNVLKNLELIQRDNLLIIKKFS